MKSILAALVLVFASSSVACVAQEGPREDVRTSTTSEALVVPPIVGAMAGSLLEALMIESVNKALFPADSFEWDRVNEDFAEITKQANVAQTVSEQRASIDGRMADLSDWELSVTNDPSDSNKAFIASLIDSQSNWLALEGSLGQLSQDETARPGLAAYVMGAQLKLSMLGKLIQLRPGDAVANRAVIVDNAKRFSAHVKEVLKDLEGDDLGWIRDTVATWDQIAVAAAK